MATAKPRIKSRISKIESYKAANTIVVTIVSPHVLCLCFVFRFAHRYIPACIPGCCCASFWAGMPALLGAWVLVNAKALGPQEGS